MNDSVKRFTPKEAYDLFNPEVVWGRVYTSYFETFPSTITVCEVDTSKALKFFSEWFSDKILYVCKRDLHHKQYQREETAFILNGEIIVVLLFQERRVEIYYS